MKRRDLVGYSVDGVVFCLECTPVLARTKRRRGVRPIYRKRKGNPICSRCDEELGNPRPLSETCDCGKHVERRSSGRRG